MIIYFTKGTILVQGSLHMAFVSLGLCKVADLVRNPKLVEAISVSSSDDDSDNEGNNTLLKLSVEKETKEADVKSAEKSSKIVEAEKVSDTPTENSIIKEVTAKGETSTGNIISEEGINTKSPASDQTENLITVEPAKEVLVGPRKSKPIKAKCVKKSTKKSIKLPVKVKVKTLKVKDTKPTSPDRAEKLDTVKPAEEMKTPPKKSKPTKVKSVTKSTKKSIKPLPVKLTKQSAENGEAEQTKLEENKVVNDTINNIQDAMVAMRSDFEQALETSNKMQLKTQEDVLDLRSLLVTVSNDLKLIETGGWKPPVPGITRVTALTQDWAADPALPQGWILERFDSLDNVSKKIEIKIETVKVELETMSITTNNLKNHVDTMIKEMKVKSNALTEGVKVQIDAEKEQSKDDSKEAEIPETATEEVEDNAVERKKDKGIIFTSSIGKGMNKERLQSATNSELELVTTYTLEKHDKTKDPDLHLLNMIEEHVNGDISFVVLGVGTNDITALDNTWPDKKEVLEQCQ